MTTVYNSAYFNIAPLETTYKHVVTDLVTTNPNDGATQMGGHDYSLKVVADVNAILADFKLRRNLSASPNTLETQGEADAWNQLHSVFNTGSAPNGAAVTSFVTTMSDGDTSADSKWTTFFAGLISNCIDNDDVDGISVKIPALQAKLNVGTDAAAANDIIGVINDAFGTPHGGADNAAVTIDTPPAAASQFLLAAAHFLYTLRGSATSLSGDPSDSMVSIALQPGDALAIRISCSVNHAKTGIIVIEQS